jgi:NAD(P)-dependent dehydrogenase (short-subunit alcohol dehydrogenase family)
MSTDYREKVVYAVGGSMGIGLAAARQFSERGAHVLTFARRPEALEAAVAEIEACRRAASQRVELRVLDVCEAESVSAVMNEAVASFGPPDVLFNCAGAARPAYFEDITHEQLSQTMQLNLHGSWNTVHALLPHMKQRGGTIVNTSSLAGIIGVFGYTDYCAAKFAVIGFSEALRSELERYGIRVFVLCPPDTDTPGLAAEGENKPPETTAVASAARLMTADAVASALIRGMERRRLLIIPGIDGRFAALAKRFFPGLVEWVTSRAIAKAGRKQVGITGG